MTSDPKPIPRPSAANVDATLSHSDRAKLLLQLIEHRGDDPEFHALRRTAQAAKADTDKDRAVPDQLAREAARSLLDKFQSKVTTQGKRAPHSVAKALPKVAVLRSTIAALIRDADLGLEHPAVVAMVLQRQDRVTKTSALRAMDGDRARRVQGALRKLRS